MRYPALLLALSLTACGGDDDSEPAPEAPEAVTPEVVTPDNVDEPASEDDPDTPSYSLHEWGLIDINLDESVVEYAAGPGRVEEGGSATASAGGGTSAGGAGGSGGGSGGRHDNDQQIDNAVNAANQLLGAANDATGGALPIQIQRPPARRRKPVVYFHLTDPAQSVTVSLTVDLGEGRLVEHFPGAQVQPHGVTWAGVTIGGESCQGGPYPVEGGPACEGVADGYCEAAELAGYVANDAGCLTFGGAESNFLFYRGDGASPSLPLTIMRGEEGNVRITNDSLGEPVGPILRLRRADDGSIRVAQVSTPAQGSSVAVGLPNDAPADTHRELIRGQLEEIGLTSGEVEAFENAWFGELFDGEAPTPHAMPDAILFFLPAEQVDGFVHLEATPPPAATVRAMAVRAGWGTR